MRRSLLTLFMFVFFSGLALAQDVVLQGDITSNMTLTADKTYLLNGFVRVKEGATLTIQPGTVIYGDQASLGTLIIQPGAKIMAQGTADNPIIFTSTFTKAGASRQPTYGDWGGVVILGKATINVAGGTSSIEGVGDTFGGTDDADNSGVFSYVRIEYPGVAITPNNEINGLTLGGVGSKTKLDHIQVSYSGDDSYEWFGGAVNAKYLIAYRGWDDDFDTDYGYHGKLQYLLGVRDPEVADPGSGSNGFESDNDGAGSTNTPRTSPLWYNVTLIGPAATKTTVYNSNFKRGMHLRRSSQNKINNAVIMGWPTGLLVDGTNTVADAIAGNMYVKNSILSGTVGDNFTSTDATFQGNMNAWFTSTNGGRVYSENTEVMLADPFNVSNPNPMPEIGSPVFSNYATPPNDGFFDVSANYVGAFGYIDWTKGWSSFTITPPAKPQGVLAGDITADMTLSANTEYTITGFVRVKSGATLTIPAGTKLYGDNSSIGTLIIQPGAKIMAQGTMDNPIVFTSQFTKAGASRQPTYGDWGGVVILGKATINVAGGTSSIEGVGDSFGGTDDADNSGVFSYVRIEYPGVAITPNNEINGLTLGGVGSGTKLDHIQVSYSGDDSYEWFGGAVNAKYLIAYRGWDDDFDTDYGYHGKLQFLLGVRDPEVADPGSGSNGFESDNDGAGSTNTPRTSPLWYNVTLIGPAATKTTVYNSNFKRGMHLRRSSQNRINNALIMGWPTGILIDGTNTVADAIAGNMYVKNSMLAGTVGDNFQSTDATFQGTMSTWFANNSSIVLSENADVKLVDPFNINSPNPFPKKDSPVYTGYATPPNDGFYDTNAIYIGAFGGSENWTEGWSSLHFVPVSVEETPSGSVPTEFALSQNYPNPFNPSTKIQFSLPKTGFVKLNVYNVLGQKVASLIDGEKAAGNYTINWDASRLSSGIYVYSLETGSKVITRKMTLLK